MKPLTYDRTKESRKNELLKGKGYDVLNVYKYDRLVSLDPLTLKKQKAIANLLKLIEYPLTADEIIGYKDEITLTVVSSRYKNRYSKKPNPDPNVVFTSPDGNVILVWID
jgi:hypothetical protein